MPLFTSDNQPKNRKTRKGCLNTSTLIKNMLNQKITGADGKKRKRLDKIIQKQIELAELGSVKSFNAIMDRLDGKPQQEIKQTEHKTLIVETAGERPAKGSTNHEVGKPPEPIKLVPPLEDEVETK